MKTFFLFLVASTAVLAAPFDKKTGELINAAMQYNFDACNRENIARQFDRCSFVHI